MKRLLFLGSSCVYPRDCPQPIKEDYLLTSPLETTNRAYALAKIAGIEMCASYNRQYGTKYLAVMPTNLYGPGDNYDLETSHVLPALIRKCHEAKVSGAKEVPLWGTGSPRREFLHSDDMAEACLFLMELPDERFAEVAVGEPRLPAHQHRGGGGPDDRGARQPGEGRRGLRGPVRLGPHASPTARRASSSSSTACTPWDGARRIALRDGIASTYREFSSGR